MIGSYTNLLNLLNLTNLTNLTVRNFQQLTSFFRLLTGTLSFPLTMTPAPAPVLPSLQIPPTCFDIP